MRPTSGLPLALVALAVAIGALPTAASAETKSTRPAYGCYRVAARGLEIHETALKSSAVVAAVSRGDILVKRHRFCSALTPVCAVSTEKGVQGFADKSAIKTAPCPARLSTKIN